MRVLSLGWGVQSFTLAAMAALGELQVDVAVHADTTWEREGTYQFAREWVSWLRENELRVITVTPERPEIIRSDWGDGVQIPAYTTPSDGQIKRQCTRYWKIQPIRRFIREEMVRRGMRVTPGVVTSIQGISLDEYTRMRTSDVAYTVHEYPLVERRMTRADCIYWLEQNRLPVPPKSACTFCPFRSASGWAAMKREAGVDWEQAIAVDAAIRIRRPKCELFLHPARKPLAEAVDILEDHGMKQLTLEESCDGGYCWS